MVRSDLSQHAADHRVFEAGGDAFGFVYGAVGQQGSEFSGRQWGAAEIALVLIAAQRAQEGELLGCLHALGDHFQVQAVCERDDGADDLGVVTARDDLADE